MKSVLEFDSFKRVDKKISVITCYDFWSARIIDETEIDAVLVGDSATMVMHGFETTVHAEVQMMLYHIAAVRRGLKTKFLIADLPFLVHKKGNRFLMDVVDQFMKAGAQAIKIEGADENIKEIEKVINSGIPVMGHLGLTPQSVNQFGGFKLQGNSEKAAEKLIKDAKKLENSGCFSIVLEMIPSEIAKHITESLSIPTIGIGAGPFTNGQVLVLQDMLGVSKDFNPKFLRKYLDGFDLIKNSINSYVRETKNNSFPNKDESY